MGIENWGTNMKQLIKMRLTISVVFSSIAGYLIAAPHYDFYILCLLTVGGFCVIAASNIFNQIIERNLDAIMDRTKMRPLPSLRMKVSSVFIIGTLFLLIGLGLLSFINGVVVGLSFLSFLLYVGLYTPLKTKTSLAVFVGAFPGAFPFLLGWFSVSTELTVEPIILFLIQFFWQFPHFWAIGWVSEKDYKKAGFKMLPSGNADSKTSFQIVFYTLWTILLTFLPFFKISGALLLSPFAKVLFVLYGAGFLYFALKLMSTEKSKDAKNLLLVSVLYITLIQITFVIDKLV